MPQVLIEILAFLDNALVSPVQIGGYMVQEGFQNGRTCLTTILENGLHPKVLKERFLSAL